MRKRKYEGSSQTTVEESKTEVRAAAGGRGSLGARNGVYLTGGYVVFCKGQPREVLCWKACRRSSPAVRPQPWSSVQRRSVLWAVCVCVCV
ncbi:hypothetical protein COCON_G00161760 [Conger conger]|uniref:Uncharacterized protein n=1 Tax=Conger conger TaxID=82655 RepID=A0A9Q1DB55_CONCO|nr:hypothetical protein COCON_G00161760 [Conger conger]